MSILYGTQSNGETLPVEVNEFGQLVAKGIEGSPGQPGPPGPPGVGELPPDPFEGAILGWKDNELAWLGGAVPLPEGTYGPYIYIPDEQRLNIPQNASLLVNGQQLYMSDQDGNAVSFQYVTDTIANVGGSPTDVILTFPSATNFGEFAVGDVVQSTEDYLSVFYGTNDAGEYATANVANPEQAFNGSESSNPVTINDSGSTASLKALELRLSEMPSNPYNSGSFVVQVKGFNGSNISLNGATSGQYFVSGVSETTFPAITTLSTINIQRTAAGQCGLFYIKINGVILNQVDSTLITAINSGIPSITVDGGSWKGSDGSGDPSPSAATEISKPPQSGEGSVSMGSAGQIMLRSDNGEWVDDFYVTAPEQRIAARKAASAAIRRNTKRDPLR